MTTGSCSDGQAMLSKSLIQFSVDGKGCVPSLLFDLRPNYGWGNEDNGNLLQKVLQKGTQCPWPHSRPPPTYTSAGNSWAVTCTVWASLLQGHCSFLLSPGVQKVLFVPSKSLFSQSCVSPGGCIVGLMATSSKRAYAIPRSAAPRASAPAAGHCWPIPPQETLKHSEAGLAQSLWGFPLCTRFCFSPLRVSGGYGFWF